MRMVFAGTGAIAVPLLEALASKGLVSLVLTAPDAPGKRGKRLLPSPVKEKAEELGLDVYQPVSIRTEAREHIASYGADTLLSFCYGKIFGPRFLSLFRETFNVPPSLLKNKPLEWVIKYSVPASGVVIGCAFTAVNHKSTNEKSKNNLAFI